MSASDLKLEGSTYCDFVTSSATGAAADADSTPTAEVFEDATDTAIETPTCTKRTSKTGNYRVPITAAAANGYEVGKTYNVVISATIGGVAAKAVVGRFIVRARTNDDFAFPGTSGRSLAVDTSGNTGADVNKWLGTAAGTPNTAGVPVVDVVRWLGTTCATPTTAGVPEVDITYVAGQAVTGGVPDVNLKTVDADLVAAKDLADAFLNRDMSDVTITNSRCPQNAFRRLVNKVSFADGIVYEEDDTTTAVTFATTTDVLANPITIIDPT